MPARHHLFVPWLVLAGACAALMWLSPGEETIPYHIAWIGLALAYDREVWALRPTLVATGIFTVVTGGALLVRAAEGVVGWQETAEIPLMTALLVLVIWNVRRRQSAMVSLSRLAARDRARAAMREQLSRLTSHEMRTPATIAHGYTELLLSRETDPERRNDLQVVQSELGRLVLASDRLVRMIRMPEDVQRVPVDLRALLTEVVDRWRVIAERTWVVDADSLRFLCSPDRVRSCLDTLVENALRYTDSGGTVRVVGRRTGDLVLVGVADSGPGLDPGLARALNDPVPGAPPNLDPYLAEDPKAQTGFGLTLVRDAAVARGGRLVAGRSVEGGALLLMAVPLVHEQEGAAPRSPHPSHREVADQPAPSPTAAGSSMIP
ncbi:MAG TPA: HAMP domain-containing sensor histidine kinase [Nocardioides sp.]|uniref:sensor histidine kinase n=1 Tax=Nocardioides sp. TaxID=35761 RepID=UPI002C5AE8C0|nr:HAMP domain-containing sensor histidine kinase [Nocardioides sp.]HQR26824.1 HAMP domain-containing sensor histidine kinase [Nocardioides sp.]